MAFYQQLHERHMQKNCRVYTASLFYDRMVYNTEYGSNRFKDVVEKGAGEEQEETAEQKEKQAKDNVNLPATENIRALKGTYRDFVIPGILKVHIDVN